MDREMKVMVVVRVAFQEIKINYVLSPKVMET